MAEAEAELARLRGEVHAKDETLNQLKLKTKAFVDNMRGELAAEKKKVADLEQQLKEAASGPTAVAPAETENLRKELDAATHREHELKARAKTFADSMKSQLAVEKDKVAKLEADLKEKAGQSSSNESGELASLQAQLSQANQQVAMMGDRLRNVEAQATESAAQAEQLDKELKTLQASSEHQRRRLENEIELLKSHERDLESAVDSQLAAQSANVSALSEEHSKLEGLTRRSQELGQQLEQYKIENEHLQKQLQDKDFQLEQLDNYRKKADECEAKANEFRAEVATLRGQLQCKADELTNFQCSSCSALQMELSNVMARVTELQSAKQQLSSAQQRQEELSRQNVNLSEQVSQRDSNVERLRSEIESLKTELGTLNTQLGASKSSSFETKQRTETAEAERRKAEESLKELRDRCSHLESKNQELTANVAAVNKDSQDKRQKAKALVISLTNEKQTLVEAKNELQKEVDRLRMELNQRNVETEKRLKQLQDESSQRIAASSTSIQSLNDEISTLKQTLTIVQESEKNQQRAKELANAKREVEDSNKKRLAAKAETQKLAVELENMHKCLTHLTEHAGATCSGDVRKVNNLLDRVGDALHVLEKRAAAGGNGKKTNENNDDDADTEVVRGPETVTSSPTGSVRSPTSFPASGTKKVEDNITLVDERVR